MDRMLPGGIDGLGIIAALRKNGSKVPILILSALSDVDERILGLKSGGDDYLVKPFQLDEKIEQLFLEKSSTGASAWNRLFDETLAALRFTVDVIDVVGPRAPSWTRGRLRVKGRGPRDTYG